MSPLAILAGPRGPPLAHGRRQPGMAWGFAWGVALCSCVWALLIVLLSWLF